MVEGGGGGGGGGGAGSLKPEVSYSPQTQSENENQLSLSCTVSRGNSIPAQIRYVPTAGNKALVDSAPRSTVVQSGAGAHIQRYIQD